MTREQEKSPSSHEASKEPKNFEIYKIQTYYSFVIFEIKKINKSDKLTGHDSKLFDANNCLKFWLKQKVKV